MSKRASRQSSKLEEKTTKTPVEEEIPEEKIVKKQFNSEKTTTTTTTNGKSTSTKTSAKEPVKMSLSELKNLKNLRKKQEHILMNIENENIQKHVQTLLEKFDPPNCTNCPKRRADRVCINKACGVDQYMQLICGKCHFDKHQKAVSKPEVDVEEYFVKLSTFMNEQKYGDKKHQSQSIDIDNLDTIFDDLDLYRQKLASLRSKMEAEIESYISPAEMQGLLQNSIMKALSLCEYDNIQEQLGNIKKSVLFEKNKFQWNDAGEKYKSFSKIFKDLEKTTNETSKKISKSFIGGMQIDLDDLIVKYCPALSYGVTTQEFKPKDGQIKITSGASSSQFYLDYKLEKEKKYKLRFRFENQPTQYIMVGVMQRSQVNNQWVYNIANQYFCKRFLSNAPNQECSRILKGSDMSQSPQQGKQIEMRIDFENNYVDFYDYPDIKNINASHTHNRFASDDYVIAFAFYQCQSIALEHFEEISSVEKLD